MAEDPYAALGVSSSATHDEIRRAWLDLARRHHPDRGGDPGVMQRVNEAWAVVGDPVRRRAWDGEHRATPTGAAAEHEPGVEDVDVDRFDDRPLAPPRRSVLDVVPVALFASSIGTVCLALALDAPSMFGFAAFLFFLSCVAVAAVAMVSMRRGVRAGRR
jgi:hypothetical protein